MRIGAVSYLNTKPLVYGLQSFAPQHELVFDLPSRLADQLAEGQLDVALIPSVEFFGNADYTIISDACIACRGPVMSVKLLSRVQPSAIRTLALDEGSRTSAALVQILLRERFGISPEIANFPIGAAARDVRADALLMIGDRAMHSGAHSRENGGSREYVAEWDLGDIWCRWAELPFVFSMWVAGPGGDQGSAATEARHKQLAELAGILSSARDAGVAHLPEIAEREHAAVGLSYDQCLTYLRDHLYFFLGPRERAGLNLFYDRASRLGLAPSRPGSELLISTAAT